MYPVAKGTDTGFRRFVSLPKKTGAQVSKEGMSFLKCTFAPPDFAANDVAGVPDDYRGPSLVKKHRYVGSLVNSVANTDTYIVLMPVPGVAYFKFTTVAGVAPTASTVLTGVAYSDSNTIFGSSTATNDVVSRFRYISNHIELIPTVNQMNWTGSISAWKITAAFNNRPGSQAGAPTNASDIYTIGGLEGLVNSNVNQWSSPVNLGVYTAAYNSGNGFPFTPIATNFPNATVPFQLDNADFGQINCAAVGSFTGFDNNFETVAIKISGQGANVNNSFIVKTWACVEYQVVSGSLLYEYQTLSPHDPIALELYRLIILQLPVGVSFIDNESFWKRVLSIMKSISSVVSFIVIFLLCVLLVIVICHHLNQVFLFYYK